jgi:hypothetical protein
MVAKSLPRKQVRIKNFHQNFLVEIFYGCKIVTSKTGKNQKFSSTFFGRKVLWLQNYYLENRFKPNIFIKILWSKIAYGCKIFTSKTILKQKFLSRFPVGNCLFLKIGLNQTFSSIFFVVNFYGFKIITWKTGLNQTFSSKFLVKNCYGCKIVTSKTG